MQNRTAPSWHALAHGVSHDGTSMVSAAQMAAEALRQGDTDPGLWEALSDSLALTSAFLQRLRGWAQGDPGIPHTIELTSWLPAVIQDVEHMATATHPVEIGHHGPLGTVRLDGERYIKAVRALVSNAMEAMPNGGHVRVYVETTPTELSVVVTDEGPGLPMTSAEAMQPYTTTKAGHKGLGLADVAAFAHGCNGSFQVTSPTDGTTAQLSIPIQMPQQKVKASAPDGASGRKAVLFVEDEPTLLRVATRVLERNGYVCHVASTVAEAVVLFEGHQEAIGLAVVDYLLPDGTGTELIHHFRQAHAGLPVILSSGISHAELHQHAAETHVDGILSKPYRSGDLLYAVQAVLPVTSLPQVTI